MCVCLRICNVSAGICGSQRRGSWSHRPWEPPGNRPLETELWSSGEQPTLLTSTPSLQSDPLFFLKQGLTSSGCNIYEMTNSGSFCLNSQSAGMPGRCHYASVYAMLGVEPRQAFMHARYSTNCALSTGCLLTHFLRQDNLLYSLA